MQKDSCTDFEENFEKIFQGETIKDHDDFLAKLTIHLIECERCLNMVLEKQGLEPFNGSPERGMTEPIQ